MYIDARHELPQLITAIDRLNHGLSDKVGGLLTQIGTHLANSSTERFNTKTAPSGVSWATLAPSTQARKGNNNILVDTGALQASILSRVTGMTIEVGSAQSYSIFHQFGTDNTPARPFLGLSETDKGEINNIINDYIQDLMR